MIIWTEKKNFQNFFSNSSCLGIVLLFSVIAWFKEDKHQKDQESKSKSCFLLSFNDELFIKLAIYWVKIKNERLLVEFWA